MKLRQKLRSNKGLTLLEVLVSVFVLAIVAGPLLNMFVTNTVMLRKSYEKTTATYDAKSVMESFYGLPYDQLYTKSTVDPASGVMTIRQDAATGRYYSLTIKPSGPYVAGKTSFYHLVIKADGSGWLARPDGTLSTVSAASLATLAPSFSGSPLLIVNTRCVSKTMNLTLGAGVTCLLYTPKNVPANKYNITPSSAVQVYNITDPPATMLLDCVLKTYKANDFNTQDSVFQTTMEVTLP